MAKTMEIILNAGIALAKQIGYVNITCKDVAKKAGVSRTLIYYYFKNYENMRIAILEEAVNRNIFDIIAQAMAIRDPNLNASDAVKDLARKHL
jgi:AcrR family transcriptional regulator